MPRAAHGKLSKVADPIDIDIDESIILRSDSRQDSDISTPRGSINAEQDAQSVRERIERSGIHGTPVKPNNLKYSGGPATRQDVLDGFTRELLDRRWSSADLVDHVFGGVVSTSLAAGIALCFLHFGILSVRVGNKKVERDDWPKACAHAASVARLASKGGKVTEKMKALYVWDWEKHVNSGTELGAERFFNMVGVAGYISASLFDPNSVSQRRPSNRITTLPRPYARLPLESPDSQDCRPDFIVLGRDAFVSEPNRDSTRLQDYLEKSSILDSIASAWPQLSRSYPEIYVKSSNTVTAQGNQPDSLFPDEDEDAFGLPLSYLPEGYDELLDDFGAEMETTRGGNKGPNTSPEEPESVEVLSRKLEAFLEILKQDHPPTLPISVAAALKEYDEASLLDLSAVCFPNARSTGECKQIDMRAATIQATVYMRQHRRTQPWLRFILGLMATKDKLGLLRADANGIEECIFPKNLGRGVIEAIRLSLGILLATDQELGQHPCFFLRDIEVDSLPYLQALKAKKAFAANIRNKRPMLEDPDDRSSKKIRSHTSKAIPSPSSTKGSFPEKFRSREVNWIRLDPTTIHSSYSGQPPSIFYVKYLIEDRGSLIGRCTRVWCVYQQVFNSDKILDDYPYVSVTSQVFKGPYALKVYNTDIYSEAYEKDILKLAIEKQFQYILLPTHVWYLGKISELVRGFEDGACPTGIPVDQVKNREETVTVSPLKRTLAQFQDSNEFYGAIIGALKGIEVLQAANLMHRDISISNIILEKEIYAADEDAYQFLSVLFVDGRVGLLTLIRREFVPIGAAGGLHDLDMSAFIPSTPAPPPKALPPPPSRMLRIPGFLSQVAVIPNPGGSQVRTKRQRDWRTGTRPFMSISLLQGGQNSVLDDIQSLFYVNYLSLFTFDTPAPNCFPNAPPIVLYNWPPECQAWADPQGLSSVQDIGNKKQLFFERSSEWGFTALNKAQPFWKGPRDELKGGHYSMLYEFHEEVWHDAEDKDGRTVKILNSRATARSIIDVLEAVLAQPELGF